MRLLAISGSLRRASTNTRLLRAAALVAPAGVEIELFTGLGDLPHFNPDLENPEPAAVVDFKTRVGACDGLVISCPEYAHGVPGALKNAFDWLVGSVELSDKPVAFFNASSHSTWAQASLSETIRTMYGRIVAEATVTLPLLGKSSSDADIVADPSLSQPLRAALETFRGAIERQRADTAERDRA